MRAPDSRYHRCVSELARQFGSLSVVIPAYNAAHQVCATLDAIQAFLTREGIVHEVIVVDDGSLDTTRDVVIRRGAGVRLIANDGNRGKGYSVRRGMLEAKKDWVLFTDVDHATPIDHLTGFGPHAAVNDILIGSRRLNESTIVRRQPRIRQAMGRVFPYLVRAFVLPQFADTQCGFKMFRREVARDLFGRAQVDRFCFDVEILAMAASKGYRVAELPVNWRNPEGGSTLRIVRDTVRMLSDLFRIRRRMKRGFKT